MHPGMGYTLRICHEFTGAGWGGKVWGLTMWGWWEARDYLYVYHMDNPIKEITDELKSRVNNPLIGSFLIAWLLINWKVFILLFFYKQSELVLNEYKSFLDVITKNITLLNGFIWPAVASVSYIIIFPIIKHCVVWYLTTISVRSDNIVLNEKIKALPYQKALKDKDIIIEDKNKDIEELRNIISLKDNEIRQQKSEIDTLKNFNSTLEGDKKVINDRLTTINNRNDYEFFHGIWDVSFVNSFAEEERIVKENWKIRSREIYVNDIPKYNIVRQIANENQILLQIVNIENNNFKHFYLAPDSNIQINLNGTDEQNRPVNLKKAP
jgi:hypothetical protein